MGQDYSEEPRKVVVRPQRAPEGPDSPGHGRLTSAQHEGDSGGLPRAGVQLPAQDLQVPTAQAGAGGGQQPAKAEAAFE